MPVGMGDPLRKRENMLNIEYSLAQLRITLRLPVLILGREGHAGGESLVFGFAYSVLFRSFAAGKRRADCRRFRKENRTPSTACLVGPARYL